jgi:pyruvyltransferase
MNDENIDYVITRNYNIAFMLNFVNKYKMYCNEIYIYKKHIIQFQHANGFPDYPAIIVDQNKLQIKNLNHCIFLHMSNFKSHEAALYRMWMCPFILNKTYDNFYEWLYIKHTVKSVNLTTVVNIPDYTFNTIIEFKRKMINYIKNIKYSCDILKSNDLLIDFTNLDTEFIDYLNKTYTITKLNNNTFKSNTYDTDHLVNIFYWGGNYGAGNFGDILSYYLFEKITGYTHKYYNILNITPNDPLQTIKELDAHFITIGSIIEYSNIKSIIWGTGIIHSNLKDKIKYDKICCVRGPRTRSALAKHDIIIDERYGDPALLTSLLYHPTIRKKYKIGIIPHQIDYTELLNIFSVEIYSNIKVINLTVNKNNKSIENVINDIISCEFILSSSLSGIILANSYNIPVIRFKHNQLSGDDIKFIDYFESVYSDKYLCESKIHITELVDNFETTCKIYKNPDLIQARQIDLIETCPFLRTTMKRLLRQRIK